MSFSFAVEWTAKEKFSDSVNIQAIVSVICCQDILYANEAPVFAFRFFCGKQNNEQPSALSASLR
ncbi:MAG: hypothetical protein U5R30_04835 [Deltaproteobacteria bacterium]|nr:hypothetical protein [Deltaproteobacteria bacterium]